MTNSDAIAAAKAQGNDVSEVSTGWTEVREVVHMRLSLGDDLRRKLMQDTRLHYWSSKATPHNRPEEGFTDNVSLVAITFSR